MKNRSMANIGGDPIAVNLETSPMFGAVAEPQERHRTSLSRIGTYTIGKEPEAFSTLTSFAH